MHQIVKINKNIQDIFIKKIYLIFAVLVLEMIVSSLKQTLTKILFNPFTLIPVILVVIFNNFSGSIITSIIERPLIDFILYYETYSESNLLFIVLTQYPVEILLLLGIGALNLVISSIALMALARIAKGDGIIDAINDSVLDWKKALALAFFIFIAIFLGIVSFFLLGSIFNFIADLIPQIGAILLLIVFPLVITILGLLIAVKTLFIIPALIKDNLKKAIQKSWKFTDNKYWTTFVYLLAIAIVVYIVAFITQNASLMLGEEYELIIFSIGDVIATTFFGLAVSYYYYN